MREGASRAEGPFCRRSLPAPPRFGRRDARLAVGVFAAAAPQETMANATTAKEWLLATFAKKGIPTDGAVGKHFIALSTNKEKVCQPGSRAFAMVAWNAACQTCHFPQATPLVGPPRPRIPLAQAPP